MLPYSYEKSVGETLELSTEIEKVGKKLINQANKMKIIEKLSKQEDVNYQMLKKIFQTRIINLEQISVKVTKEKEKFFIQTFEENSLEEKVELKCNEKINKRNLYIRLNKKVKIFY